MNLKYVVNVWLGSAELLGGTLACWKTLEEEFPWSFSARAKFGP